MATHNSVLVVLAELSAAIVLQLPSVQECRQEGEVDSILVKPTSFYIGVCDL